MTSSLFLVGVRAPATPTAAKSPGPRSPQKLPPRPIVPPSAPAAPLPPLPAPAVATPPPVDGAAEMGVEVAPLDEHAPTTPARRNAAARCRLIRNICSPSGRPGSRRGRRAREEGRARVRIRARQTYAADLPKGSQPLSDPPDGTAGGSRGQSAGPKAPEPDDARWTARAPLDLATWSVRNNLNGGNARLSSRAWFGTGLVLS